MAIPISTLVNRLRSSVDAKQYGKDVISQDGATYVMELSFSPVMSGTDRIYINHSTYTTGLNQLIYRNGSQTSGYAASSNIVYEMDYTRGEIYFFRGSGYISDNNDLRPFAPWATSTITAYYEYAKYSDVVLSDYVSYAVAAVEASLNIGMYVSGCIPTPAPAPGCDGNPILSDNPPYERRFTDTIRQMDSAPYDVKVVIAENLEIIQSLIAKKAAFDLMTRERRIGAGNAIKIVDGDTQVDTSVNQRYLADYIKDMNADYQDQLKWVLYNLVQGYSLKQMDEMAYNQFNRSRYQYDTSPWYGTGGVIL